MSPWRKHWRGPELVLSIDDVANLTGLVAALPRETVDEFESDEIRTVWLRCWMTYNQTSDAQPYVRVTVR